MKKFKQYINEILMWQQSLSSKIFDVGQGKSIGFDAFWIPLSSSIMKRIWPKEVRATVFHVTDDRGYEKIKKMQGKKGGISAFFEMRGNYFEQGIQTKGGVVIELDANILGAFNQDVMSAPDNSGRRWIQLEFLKGRFGVNDLSAYQKGLQDLVGEILKKYLPIVMKHTRKSPPKTMKKGNYYFYWMDLGMYAAQEPGKKTILGKIIKEYIDGVEAIYKKNANHLKELLTDYMKLRRTEEAWDEIIANNFKIKKIWLIPYSRTWNITATDPENDDGEVLSKMDKFIKKVKDDRFPIEKTSNMDLEIHTRKIVRKEIGT